jgi:hypothetical protein
MYCGLIVFQAPLSFLDNYSDFSSDVVPSQMSNGNIRWTLQVIILCPARKQYQLSRSL